MRTIIEVRVVNHADQRYPSWADWQWFDNDLLVTVSNLHNWRYEFLSAIHELLEAMLCRHQGITQADVDAFDLPYEQARIAGEWHAPCGCKITNDPGSDIHAPYRAQHLYATSVEYGLAYLLGVDAAKYDADCAALDGGVKVDETR